MANVEKNSTEQNDIQYFEKMVSGARDIVEPWKTAVTWLIVALVASNLIWGTIHGYSIYKAYQEPSTYEQKQDQLFDQKSQTQNNKGSVK